LNPQECVSECVEKLGVALSSAFYDLRHQTVFDVMKEMVDAMVPVDVLTLRQRLVDKGLLEDVGGLQFVQTLPDQTPTSANLDYYLTTVRERWQLRRLAATCTELAGMAMDRTEDVEGLMAVAEAQLTAVTTPSLGLKEKHIRELMPGVIDDLEKYHRGTVQLQGLPTGFSYLDKVIGGIGEEYYWTVAGRPGSGKTTLALDVVNYLTTRYEHWADTGEKHDDGTPKMEKRVGVPVGVFSLEMSSRSLARRMVFCQARVSSGKHKQGFMTNDAFERLVVAVPKMGAAPIYIDEEPSQTIGKIRAKATRMARQYGIKLFVLDYLQLVLPNERSSRPDRVQELTDISAQIVWLKKKLGIPWLVLAQMNRNIETSERTRIPVLSDLKDCGAIEQDADVVQFLHRPTARETAEDDEILEGKFGGVEFSERPRRIDAVVAKNRDGATGIAKLLFHANQFRFEDWREWEVTNQVVERAAGEKMPTSEEMEFGGDET